MAVRTAILDQAVVPAEHGTVLRGDLEGAFRQYRSALERRLIAITGDRSTAEDLTQEAFARLAAEIAAGRAPDSTGAWLHRVAANLAATRGRRTTVAERHLPRLAVQGDSEPSPETLVVAAEEARALREALARLSRHDRRALLLAAHGYRGPDIAALMGSSAGAMRTRLHRARMRLRAELAAAGSG